MCVLLSYAAGVLSSRVVTATAAALEQQQTDRSLMQERSSQMLDDSSEALEDRSRWAVNNIDSVILQGRIAHSRQGSGLLGLGHGTGKTEWTRAVWLS